jgi:hypothetical protein
MNAITKAHTTREQQALDVFHRHVSAFFSGDLSAVLADFDPDSVVITPDDVFEGPERIREMYQKLLEEFGVIVRGDSPGIFVDTLLVHHDTILITWHAESKNLVFPFGTDTFICNGDRFARQSIAYSPPRPR